MSQQLRQLEELQIQLHEANEALAAVSREVDRVSELDLEGREHLANRYREAQARWEAVTTRISQVIQTPARVVFEQIRAEDKS